MMSLLSFLGAGRKAKAKLTRQFAQLRLEQLEDRRLLATFTVGPTGNFGTLEQAINAAAAGDTLIVQAAGAPLGTGNATGATVNAATAAGSSTLVLNNPAAGAFNVGDVVQVGAAGTTEVLTIKSITTGATTTLTFTSNTRFAHAAAEATTEAGVGVTKQLTITGDPNAARAPITGTGFLLVSTGVSGVSLSHVAPTVGLWIDQGASKNTINDVGGTALIDNPYPNNATATPQPAVLANFGQVTSTTNGSDTVTNSTFTGIVNVNGNTTGTATSDSFSFDTLAGVVLFNADGTSLSNNTITGGVLIANGASTAVTLTGNTISGAQTVIINAKAVSGAVVVTQPAAATAVNVAIRGNTISTANVNQGIVLDLFQAANAGKNFTAAVEGNDLRNNKIGVLVSGDAQAGDASAFGTVDLGGGSLSNGGNNFKSFNAGSGTGGVGASFLAISAINGDGAGKATISAKNNSFSVADPTTVIQDFTHNKTVTNPVGVNGDGSITVTALSATDAFITAAYLDFLGRAAGASELTAWDSVFASGGSAAVANGIVRSAEALGRDVDRLYLRLLGRTSDSAGRAGWVGLLQRGGTIEQVIIGMVNSAEFANRLQTTGFNFTVQNTINDRFVTALYELLLGRGANIVEVNNWLGVLGNQGPNAVAAGIVNSLEFRQAVVSRLYGLPVTPAVTAVNMLGVPNLLRRQLNPPFSDINANANTGLGILSLEAAFTAGGEFQANG
jgi:hypothetical protein